MAYYSHDSGFVGRVVSLAGIKGREGLGLTLQGDAIFWTTGAGRRQILPANPGRVFALITNDGPVDLILSFTESSSFNIHTLRPGGSFQIDRDFSWTGAVWANCATTAGIAGIAEALIQS